MHRSVPRTPASTSVLVRVAESEGVSAERSLRGTGLTLAALANPGTEVSQEQEIGVIANVVRALGDPLGVGAAVGAQFHLTTYGVWGFALLSSPTLRSAIATGLQFLELTFALSRIVQREGGDEVRLYFDVSRLPPEIRRFVAERDGMAVRNIQREMTGDVLPLRRVVSAFPGNAEDAAHLGRLLEAEVTFNAPRTYASFDRALLDRPMPQADPTTAAMALAQCEALLAARRSRLGTAGAVRAALLSGEVRWADIATIATRLHMSERTLQRRLIDEGTSFRDLVAEVRESLAVELLDTGMPVAEISQRLGYVEVSSFSQAFRRWKGVGPRAYRASTSQATWAHPTLSYPLR